MISQKEYCEHSGLSKGQVSKLVARGMPLTSTVDADRWRGMTAKRPIPLPPSPAQPEAPPPPPAPEAPAPNSANPRPQTEAGPPPSISADTPEGAYERQRQIERAAYGLAIRALKERQPDAGRLIQIHASAASNLTRAREEVVQLAEREGRLMSSDWVKKVIAEHDGAVVALAKAMPRLLSGRICPEDPERAEQELNRWVEETFLRTLYASTPWTKTN